MQKTQETEENQVVHSYIETKIRKLQENVDTYWQQEKEKEKTRRVGSNETVKNASEMNANDKEGSNVDELLRQKI